MWIHEIKAKGQNIYQNLLKIFFSKNPSQMLINV